MKKYLIVFNAFFFILFKEGMKNKIKLKNKNQCESILIIHIYFQITAYLRTIDYETVDLQLGTITGRYDLLD